MEPETPIHRDQCSCTCPHLFSVADGAAANCVLQDCVICPTIAKLDAEILKTHNALVELSKQRSTLKSQVNYHHKPLINRLPFELLSEIFINVLGDYSLSPYWSWSYAIPLSLRLGRVCRMWRDVTLQTPKMWTMVTIKVKSCSPPYEIDVAKEWLHRSRSLPLYIKVDFRDCGSMCSPDLRFADPPFDSSIDLIRSHSTRWWRIDINCNDPYLIHQLLDNLEHSPPIDLESLSVDGPRANTLPEFSAERVFLPRSVSQTDSQLGFVGLWDLPCGFERLTKVEMHSVPIEEAFYFIRNAPNLMECIISLDEDAMVDVDDRFSLPTTPIIAQHLTLLETCFSRESEFFDYLTLPSLRTLKHEYYTIAGQDELDILINCLDRSSPPLQDFHLNTSIVSSDVDDWYELLPEVTSLILNLSEIYPAPSMTQCHNTEGFLAALARHTGTLALPKLRSLSFSTRGMSEASWSSLYNIFQDQMEPNPGQSQDRSSETDAVQPFVCRDMLKKIQIDVNGKWERHFDMEKKVFERFEELKNVGIELKVSIPYGPKFGDFACIPPVIDTVE